MIGLIFPYYSEDVRKLLELKENNNLKKVSAIYIFPKKPTGRTLAKAFEEVKLEFKRKLDELKPKVLILFGEEACFPFLGRVSIGKVLLQIFSIENSLGKFNIIPMYHTTFLVNNKKFASLFDKALSLAYNLINDVKFEMPPIYTLESEEDFVGAFNKLQGKEVAIDFETSHFYIFRGDFNVISSALAVEDAIYTVRFDNSLQKRRLFEKLLTAPSKFIFHNYLFDGIILKKEFGVHAYEWEDTMILSYLIDENRSKSLKFLASIYLNAVYSMSLKEVLKNKVKIEDIEENTLKVYNATDAYATLKLYPILLSELNESLLNLYRVFIKKHFVPVLFEMTYNGFPVDPAKILELDEKFKNEEKALLEKLNSYPSLDKAKRIITALESRLISLEEFMKTGKVDMRSLPQTKTDICPTKNHHILAVLVSLNKVPEKRTEKGAISVAEDVLKKINMEEIDTILQIKKYRKLRSTYLKEYLTTYLCPDNRVHPAYSLTTTVTGRTSSSNPNLQNIPRDSVIKDIFVAPPGYKIVQYDWSQIELRVASALSKDEKMISVYKNKIDLHKRNASLLFNKPEEEVTKEERQLAKGCSFGILYGISAKGLAERFNIPEQKAAKLIEGIFKEYPTLANWQKQIKQKALTLGFVVSPLGRVRRLYGVYSSIPAEREEALRQAVNFPVQSTASDINLLFLSMILKKNIPNIQLVCSVHDSGVFLVKEEMIDEFVNLLYNEVEELTRKLPFLKGVPLEIEVSVGDRWGSLKKWGEE